VYPRLRQFGLSKGVRADHIIGVTTLLADAQDRLYKDTLLVREDRGYATLDERVLGNFRLTSRLEFPVPAYSGKLACVFDAIGKSPYLYAGDSPGDHALLTFSHNRLWIAQLEKPNYQKAAADLYHQSGKKGWLFQATLTKESPGFVANPANISKRLQKVSPAIRQSIRILAGLNSTNR